MKKKSMSRQRRRARARQVLPRARARQLQSALLRRRRGNRAKMRWLLCASFNKLLRLSMVVVAEPTVKLHKYCMLSLFCKTNTVYVFAQTFCTRVCC